MAIRNQLKINGKNAYTEWNMMLDTTSMSALMTPAPLKENVKSSSRLSHGTRVSHENQMMAERNVSLTLQFFARNESEFFGNYAAFCNELSKGFLDIETSFQPGVVYHFEYRSCQQFTQFNRSMAKFVLRLIENDPSNRV